MKKLLSIILVLAMLLGMASVGAFAETGDPTSVTLSSSSINMLTGETHDLTANVLPADANNKTVTWSVPTGTTVTVSTGGTVTAGDNEGTTSVRATSSVDTVYADCSVKVFKKGLFQLNSTTTSYSLKKGSTQQLSSTYGYTGTVTGWEAATVTSYDTSNSSVATVSNSGLVTAKGVGDATITLYKKIDGKEAAKLEYSISVYDLEVSYDVENYDDIEVSLASLKDDIEDEIYDEEGKTVTVNSIAVKFIQNSLGTLSTGTTVGTSNTSVGESGVKFTAAKGSVGKAIYQFTAQTTSSPVETYVGSLIFNIKPYEEIDEEVTGTFTHNKFHISMPSDLDYWKVVDSATDMTDKVFTTSGMSDDDDDYLFDPSKHTATNGTVTLYVVGFDGNYVSTGTVKVENLDYDIRYVGEVDAETSFKADDFEDLYEAIFEESVTSSSSTAYVEFKDVKFTYTAKNKNYTLYNDGTEMSTTALKTVKKADLDDVTVTPLKSGDHYITVTLEGDYYSSETAKTSKTQAYTAVVLVSAVSGDVEYSVVSGSYVYLNETDFQDFAEDAQTSKAQLNYIIIDDSDLNVSKEGYFSLSGTKVVDLDGEKLYFEASKNTQYEISDARFVAAKLATHGSKIYVPFKAYGSKTGSSTGSTLLGEGYIQFTVANNPFTDVAKTDYFYDSVLWATAKGITKGTNVAGTLFSPAQGCTRAQVVTFLYRAAGSKPVSTTERSAVLATFKDLDATKHKDYIDAIAWAKANNITSGTSATTFGPDKTCTRAQIVTLIANYAKNVDKKSVTPIYTNQFTDVKPTTTHKSYAAAIQWAVEKGITKGTNAAGTLFSPDATCTRGQVVTFLYNYFK